MLRAAGVFAVFAAVGCAVGVAAAATTDGAVIVDSGSTNTPGYRIVVRSDGNATVVSQKRGVTSGASRPFTLAPHVASQFFANLKAVRTGNVAGQPCMKSASFGTTTHVTWHGWTSPDLDCPADSAPLTALIASVNAIRSAAGVGSLPGPNRGGGGPLHAQPTPATAPPPSEP